MSDWKHRLTRGLEPNLRLHDPGKAISAYDKSTILSQTTAQKFSEENRMTIRELFQGQIDRRIEEVIKVDQTDKQIIRNEIQEYVPTESIKRHYTQIFERYYETANHPHEGIAIWVSGFFGSGKSSFAKLLGLALENQDILSGNISSEIRGKIQDIATKVAHPFAQKVAKAICLLQFVKSVHRTAENIAASLHPSVDFDSVLPTVKDAIEELLKGHYIRQDGFRIPTPAEDDWERLRAQFSPQPADENRILGDAIIELWEPQPSHHLAATKIFKGGLFFNARQLVEGDIDFYVTLAEEGDDFTSQETEMRTRSQTDTKAVFWVGATNKAIGQKVREVYRSKEIISKKSRMAQTSDEKRLVFEESKRLSSLEGEVRLLLKSALLSGSVFFRGNDRSPGAGQAEIRPAAEAILATVLPDVFHRFSEGAAKVKAADLTALLTMENLSAGIST